MMSEKEEFLSIHYFKTCRVRHWVSQEVFLCPDFVILKVYATIANLGIDFIPCSFPKAAAFGEFGLPAAFIGEKPMGTEEILSFFRSIVDICQSSEEQLALICLTRKVLGEAIRFTLWGHKDCYERFTKPVMKDSISRPYADVYCHGQREEYKNKDLQVIDNEVKSLLKYLNSKIRSSKFFFQGDSPSLCDIVIYAYLSVLLSIPEKFCPLSFARSPDEDTQEIMNRLRSFLLDFDDFLWQLNSQRSEGPVRTASRAALWGMEPSREETQRESDSIEKEKPLLGTNEQRTQNIVFLTIAAATVFAVLRFSPKS
jgi:hypothetical protein